MPGTVHPHAELIHRFYRSFAELDADGMVACYHDQVSFSDPVFPQLHGDQARGMWRMLCERASEFELTYDSVAGDDRGGSAHWEARYLFSKTGRRVHNKIDARFEFRDGLIYRHTDRFGLWRWSRQALGAPGLLLGWSPVIRRAVRRQAATGLNAYMARA